MGTRTILAFAAVVAGAMAGLAFGASDREFVAATMLFWFVVVAASLCLVAAFVLTAVAWRRDVAEVGYLSTFFAATSVLPLVHGLTIPGVLYGPNTATAAAVFWAVPLGLAALLPLAVRRRALGRAIGRRWRFWWATNLTGYTILAVVMLARPNLVPVPAMGSAVARIVALGCFAAAVAAALRQAHLSRIAQRPGPAVVAYALVLTGASSLVFIAAGPWTPHFWLAHGVDVTGVFLGTIGGTVVYLRERRISAVLDPVIAVDPHAALEIGLSPVVHRFTADLEAKDATTRDHVIRTAELAIDCAEEMGLDADDVRTAGMVALLHDIGKVAVPDGILTKPGRLTDDEFAVMKSHAAKGAELLRAAPGLENLAAGVGAHHERIDGRGYPNGLAGDDIPLAARICAACDAFDAMSVTRHYRGALDPGVVRATLREHAGAQWDPSVVDALLRVVGSAAWDPTPRSALRDIGRTGAAPSTDRPTLDCDCLDHSDPGLAHNAEAAPRKVPL